MQAPVLPPVSQQVATQIPESTSAAVYHRSHNPIFAEEAASKAHEPSSLISVKQTASLPQEKHHTSSDYKDLMREVSTKRKKLPEDDDDAIT
jgi:hypothetical protein